MPRVISGDAPKASDRAKQEVADAFGAREKWLHDAADMIVAEYPAAFDLFGETGHKHLAKVRVSTGFPSRRGENGKVIGQCWNDKSTKDQSHHIFISPLLEDALRVVATLAHELVHAADNGEHTHKGLFVKAVRAMGLVGKPTATFAGDEFATFAKTVVKALGKYPHVALSPTLIIKTQKTYMLKMECPGCGCIVRMTQKWLDDAGAPFCGTRSHMVDGERTDKRIRMEQV